MQAARLRFSGAALAFCGRRELVCDGRGILIATPSEIPPSGAPDSSAASSTRILSLDVFRGLTIAGMILVNDPGTWGAVYWPLDHAEWNGWTPTDLVFPFFLFIVGVSMTLSFAARLRRGGTRGPLARHVVLRGLAILAVGLVLNVFPHFHFATMRYPGVLQRIGVCYLIAGLFVLMTARRADSGGFEANIPAIAGALVTLLVGYWVLMRFVPVPGIGAGHLDPENNLAAWVDRHLLYGHMWSQLNQVRDPEGFLSTLPAIGTALWGVLVGEWIRGARPAKRMLIGLFGVGAAAMAMGRLLHPIFPINKNLWTSTFVIFTAGFAMVVLAACYWLVDVKGWRRWAAPFVVFGTNAIAAYVVADLLAIGSLDIHWRAGAKRVSLHGYIYSHFFATLAQPKNASLLFAVFFVVACYLPIWLLYRRRIFIRL
jgi:predicted acyltransferase